MRYMKLLGTAMAAVLAMASAPAWADGTAANTAVNNTATLTYQSGAVTQPGVTSNTATFLVDRRVSLTVAEVGAAATIVAGGGTVDQATTFTVTNTSNAPLDFGLSAANIVGGTAPFGGTDSFDVTNFRFYVESGTTPGFDATDTLVTYLDELPADTTRTVYVVANVPVGTPNGAIAAISLTAQAREAGTANTQGAIVTESTGADVQNAVDTVFGDIAGTDDIARDGRNSARDQYNVTAATIALVKSVTVVSDPFNGTTNPKAIPGAILEYCLIVNNTGAAAAANVAITDPVPTQTTYIAGSGYAGGLTTGTGAATTCDTTGANGGTLVSPNAAGQASFTAAIASVPANSSRTARFRVSVK
jgi:uncharacterized repeat protein (TIGR01451 family)